jgi:hypothetical protein
MAQGIQRTDNDEIARYLEGKGYLVQVTLHEARGLISAKKTGLVNCYAMITVANEVSQTTRVIPETTSATWEQQFTFKKVYLPNNKNLAHTK